MHTAQLFLFDSLYLFNLDIIFVRNVYNRVFLLLLLCCCLLYDYLFPFNFSFSFTLLCLCVQSSGLTHAKRTTLFAANCIFTSYLLSLLLPAYQSTCFVFIPISNPIFCIETISVCRYLQIPQLIFDCMFDKASVIVKTCIKCVELPCKMHFHYCNDN